MNRPQKVALLLVLVLGALARAGALARQPNPDAFGYLYHARLMSWADPWGAGPREPLWTLLVKVATAPAGYAVEAIQALSWVIGVLALAAAAWALRAIGCRGWIVVLGTAALASSERLVLTSGQGTRESTAALGAALAVGIVARAPHVLPVLAAVLAAIRWEMGVTLVALSCALAATRAIQLRWLCGSIALGSLLMGPFLVNNAREYGDPMFHSNIHATFYMNLERTEGVVVTEPPLPEDERIHPTVGAPMYRAPLISWATFVNEVLGPAETARRVARATVVLPVDALRLGWLPWTGGAVLVGFVVRAAARRRDRVVLVTTGLTGAAVLGYGMLLPWFDRRLVSHLAVVLVLLACAPRRAATATVQATPMPTGGMSVRSSRGCSGGSGRPGARRPPAPARSRRR